MNEGGLPWWAEDLLRVAKSNANGNGRPRGRVSIVPGEATVLVEGRGFRPSEVRLKTPVFDRRKWDSFYRVFAGKALYPAALFAGYLPRAAKGELARRGVRLVPSASRIASEPQGCAEDTLAGAIRLVAERFAADPFHLLHFRGANREAVLRGISESWRASGGGSGPALDLDELMEILDRPPDAKAAGSFLPAIQQAEAFRDDPILRGSLSRLYVKVAERAAASAPRAQAPVEDSTEADEVSQPAVSG